MAILKPLVDGIEIGIKSTKELEKDLMLAMIHSVYKGCQKTVDMPHNASAEAEKKVNFINSSKESLSIKCQDAWLKIDETNLDKFTGERKPLLLMGPPGHGKTAIVLSAAKKICDMIGMNYVERPSIDHAKDRPLEETFFDYPVVVEAAGAGGSATNLLGVPSKGVADMPDGTRSDVMNKLAKFDVKYLSKCQGGVYFMDDALNAMLQHQSIFMEIAQFGCLNEFNLGTGTYRLFSGNIAGKDGSLANKASTPFKGRVKAVYTECELNDWLDYIAVQTCEDPMGDLGLSSFFQTQAGLFSKLPSVKASRGGELPPSPNPRTWSNAIPEIRGFMTRLESAAKKYGNYGLSDDELDGNADNMPQYAMKVQEITESLHQDLTSIVGKECAGAVREFYKAYRMGAFQIASNVMETGEFNKFDCGIFSQRYGDFDSSKVGKAFNPSQGDAMPSLSLQEKAFGYAYVNSLCDKASVMAMEHYQTGDDYITIENQEGFGDAIKNFAIGLQPFSTCNPVNNEFLGYAVSRFVKKLNDIRGSSSLSLPKLGSTKSEDSDVKVSSKDTMADLEFLAKTMIKHDIPTELCTGIITGMSEHRDSLGAKR